MFKPPGTIPRTAQAGLQSDRNPGDAARGGPTGQGRDPNVTAAWNRGGKATPPETGATFRSCAIFRANRISTARRTAQLRTKDPRNVIRLTFLDHPKGNPDTSLQNSRSRYLGNPPSRLTTTWFLCSEIPSLSAT